jgi:hypothetical protein
MENCKNCNGVIRWRYINESPDKFGWPNYGRILKEKVI